MLFVYIILIVIGLCTLIHACIELGAREARAMCDHVIIEGQTQVTLLVGENNTQADTIDHLRGHITVLCGLLPEDMVCMRCHTGHVLDYARTGIVTMLCGPCYNLEIKLGLLNHKEY
jgi:hypothetical protein